MSYEGQRVSAVLRGFYKLRRGDACWRALFAVLAGNALLSACVEKPPPRSFTEFMEDRIAREGTLVRCNADRQATAGDLECINARRAAAAIAAQSEAAERERRDAASEALLLAARQRHAAEQAAAREAELAARAEELRAYEAQWTAEPGSADSGPHLAPIALPARAKPIDYEPPAPKLEEIVVSQRLKEAP